MTAIEFNFTDNQGLPDNGTVTFTPTRRNRHEAGVSLPEPFAKNLTDQGTFSVELKPTPPHWVWRITVQINGQKWDTEYYYIPDRNFPIRYEDLTPVDPSTVQTGLNPEPAWWAHVDAVKASADEIAELSFQAKNRIGNAEDILSSIEQARDDALTQIDSKLVEANDVASRTEEILAEVRRHHTQIVGN